MLSSIVPRAEYAEDQAYYKSILTTHVLYRGFQSGAVLGVGIGFARALILRRRGNPIKYPSTLLRSMGVWGITGTALMVVGLPIMMMNKENIEWRDRSYRLLANQPQEEVDNWTLAGSALGGIATVARGTTTGPGAWKMVLGGIGAGNLLALGSLMLWRLAVRKESTESVKPDGPVNTPTITS
jgi:hypothetical protein